MAMNEHKFITQNRQKANLPKHWKGRQHQNNQLEIIQIDNALFNNRNQTPVEDDPISDVWRQFCKWDQLFSLNPKSGTSDNTHTTPIGPGHERQGVKLWPGRGVELWPGQNMRRQQREQRWSRWRLGRSRDPTRKPTSPSKRKTIRLCCHKLQRRTICSHQNKKLANSWFKRKPPRESRRIRVNQSIRMESVAGPRRTLL